MNKMKIDIWSDIACPYCYIGKRKLEAALDKFPHKDEVEIGWHSYELNPSLPKSPIGKSASEFYAENHNQTLDEAIANNNKLTAMAKEVGLDFNFDQLVITNTSDALRLVKLSKQYDKADDAEELLFKAYFVEGKSVSDRTTLINIAKQLSLPQEKVEEMLDSDAFLAEINNDIRYSEDTLNLEYIPFYLFNKQNIIEGSIAIDSYLEVLEKSYNQWKEKGEGSLSSGGDSISGQACSIDGVCSI